MLTSDGYQATESRYHQLRSEHEGQYVYDFREEVLNQLGYDLLEVEMVDLAVDVLRLNTVAYPAAFNTWDSLGEALARRGDVAEAIAAYERSLDLNPENENGRSMLEGLREEKGRRD